MSTPTNPTPRQVTQARHPWRAVIRTVFAAGVSLAAIWGLIIQAAGVNSAGPIVAATLAVAGAITRILAIPGVEAWLRRFFPWLAAAPKLSE